MKCKNKKICNVCNATFKMKRGCNLEKRCEPCRFLSLQVGIQSSLILKDDNFSEEFESRTDLYYIGEEGNDWLVDARHAIDTVLEKLSSRESSVVKFRFGLTSEKTSLTLREIGFELNVTAERVRSIESAAIKKLKHPKVSRRPFEELDTNRTKGVGIGPGTNAYGYTLISNLIKD